MENARAMRAFSFSRLVSNASLRSAMQMIDASWRDYLGAMLWSPPGLPGGGMTRSVPLDGGCSTMPGSTPAGGHTTPSDSDNWRLKFPLDPVVSPPTDGAVRSSTPGGQAS
jgi:hypothetical protein